MSKFYLTNAIAYVNAGPHMGHALEMLIGDALTRYHRMIGDDTRFLVGTDEHGSKIAQTAATQGVTPQELADKNAALFVDFHKKFNAANDDFIRTTSERHKKGAQKLWKMMEAADVFYEKEYEGLYCTGCEVFLPEKDLVDGKCAIHQRAPELLKEKNIFFKLSNYTDVLREKIESGEFEIRPESRRNEFLSFLKEGLKDVSFSRPKSSLEWGIEVPGHEDQVMYVWCDALSNYLTALGFAEDDALVSHYWPADVHLVGKDIIRFHCGIWPAMLMAAGLPIPKAVYVHGFVTSEGQKMSKSLGNVVDPMLLLEQFPMESIRYYLLREIPTDEDGDFSIARFKAVYHDDLQNTIGNLIRRVVAMGLKYLDGDVPVFEGKHEAIESCRAAYHHGFNNFDVREACDAILELARFGNLRIEQEKPWQLAKSNPERIPEVLSELVAICRHVGLFLHPIIPEASQKILDQVGDRPLVMGEPLFPSLDSTDSPK